MNANSKKPNKHSPPLSYKRIEEASADLSGNSSQQNALTSSFETDLSAPRRIKREDPAQELMLKYQKDPKYSAYVQVVERCLQSFDYVSEWADVTAFLTKLERSFKTYSRFAVIPHKETVAKRLAQCLNPALPTGVHQKALGIYDLIFSRIGREQLVADLPLYSYGLFPFMRNASLATKPQLVGIFTRVFLPLGSSLRPCIKSFTAGILPGLEEGSAEVSESVMELLDRLRDTVDTGPFFFQTMFLVMITNVEQRESALKYLAQRLPVFSEKTDVQQVCGDQGSLMVRALAATLSDSKTLVLRAVLDLIMTRIPLRACALEHRDMVLLIKCAAEVVLKKDMSLNRRFYTWVLGPGDTDAEQSTHFAQYAQKPLTEALLASFAATNSLDNQHTVLRVLIGLIDKPVISQPVLNTIFVPLLQQLMAGRDGCSDKMLPAKLASVSRMFVEMLDPIFAWSSVIGQLTRAAKDDDLSSRDEQVARALRLLLFIVQTFELDDDATLQVHIPMALVTVLATLDRIAAGSTNAALYCCFTRMAIELLTRVPTSVFADPGKQKDIGRIDISSMFETAHEFYNADGGSDSKVESEVAKVVQGTGLLSTVVELSISIAEQLGLYVISEKASESAVVAVEDICHILRTATTYVGDFYGGNHDFTAQLQSIQKDSWASNLAKVVTDAKSFAAADAALSTLLELSRQKLLQQQTIANKLNSFVERLWAALSADSASSHFRAVQLLCLLRQQTDACTVERTLAAKLSEQHFVSELPRYTAFWRNLRLVEHGRIDSDALAFSRLLLLVLDNTHGSERLDRQSAARAWIVGSIGEWESIVETLLVLLMLSVRTERTSSSIVLATGYKSVRQEHLVAFDCGRTSYYLETLQRYLDLAGSAVIRKMVSVVPVSTLAGQARSGIAEPGSTWMQVVALAALEFALTDAPEKSSAVADIDMTRARAGELAASLISRAGVVWPAAQIADMQSRTVDALLYCVLHGRSAMQPPLLDLLSSLIQAQVHSQGSLTVAHSHGATVAGLASDIRIFSRLMLAAFTLQLDVVALNRWAQFLQFVIPFAQRHVAAEHSVLQWMALPCLHTLRMVVVQCAWYVAHPSKLRITPRHRRTSSQLLKRLVPLFAIPTDVKREDTAVVPADVLLALLDAFDALLSLCLRNKDHLLAGRSSNRPESRASDMSTNSTESVGSTPILWFMSSIFGQEEAADNVSAEDQTTSHKDHQINTSDETAVLGDIDSMEFDLIAMLAAVQDVWDAFSATHLQQKTTEDNEQRLLHEFGVDTFRGELAPDLHMKQSIHTRVASLIEHAAAAQPAEVALAMAALWISDNPQWNTHLDAPSYGSGRATRRRRQSSLSSLPASRKSGASDSTVVLAHASDTKWNWRAPDLLERVPGRAPAAVLTTLLNDLHLRSTVGGSMQNRALIGDAELARFIELYAGHRLTARASAILVPHMLVMLREYAQGLQHLGAALPFVLRMFTELCIRAMSSDTNAPELGTLYAQMVDACVAVCARSADTEMVDRVLACVANMVIPQLPLLVPDFERQTSLATHLMQQAISPALRAHMTGGYSGAAHTTTQTEHFAFVLQCLTALSQHTSLTRVWRRDTWDFFCDAKFFAEQTMSVALAAYWRQLVRQLLTIDKDQFTDLLGRIAASAPALFANRIHEAQMRALALRRLSFAIWAGSTNQHLSQLPHVQERLVDILKNAPLPIVQSEVFLCLRVLLCRISNQHMSNFWPMLLTELMRLCLQQLSREGPEDKEQANLFLAACKFLDLLFVLGTEDFMVHQWIFITDTIDALYGSRSASHALLDQLSARLLSMPSKRRSASRKKDLSYPPALLETDDDNASLIFASSVTQVDASLGLDMDSTELQTLGGRPLKRPLISIRSITSVKELDVFVHNASAQAFQSAFTTAVPDTEYIEALLLSDIMYLDFTSSVNNQSPSMAPAGFISDFEL
ncbi:hypothetical protein EV183_004307 [Coemansia sp. RSA 2336]|nr:hypothetical protein EV183_004307 [Coemansia sp. RSA 2336]